MYRYIKYLFVLSLLSVFVASCSDDTDFSSNPDLHLSFSSDTISFDTLFTETGSPTSSFLAFNRNGSSLKISDVRLGSGSSSPFRVNVDGQHGYDIRDVDVRSNDSIFIFVNVALDRNDDDLPLMVRDSLVFTLASGVVQQVQLVACGRNAERLRGVCFEGDTTLSPIPYIVYDSLVVAPGACLTLSAGCELYFHAGAGMDVHGSLRAMGTNGSPVLFRGDRTDNLLDYLPYDRVPGQWKGITFHAESTGNILDWCDIHSADYGVHIVSGDTTVQRLNLTNSKLCNFSGNALESENAIMTVENSLVANAGGNCVKVVGGSVQFIHCTIANFYVWKQRDVALALHNTLDGNAAPLRKALFANCIITGSKNDEIMGYFSEYGDTLPNASNYRFVSSLLNTRAAEDDANFVDIIWDEQDVFPFAKEHFVLIDNTVYKYDFHLDSLSSARGIANKEYSQSFTLDLDCLARPVESADAGCYMYSPQP